LSNNNQSLVFSCKSLRHDYEGNTGFTFLSEAFSIYENETIAIVGKSGDGKSTFLRLLEGSLYCSGILNRKKTALIYQDLRLVDEKTTLDNILMGALSQQALFKFDYSSRTVDQAKNLIHDLGLTHLLQTPVSQLSGGQKQRVAIGRALMSEPNLLIADEPFSHLDYHTSLEIYDLLKSLQSKNKFALIISIHDKKISEFNFDKIWLIESGKLFFQNSRSLTKIETKTSSQIANSKQKKAYNRFEKIFIYFILFSLFVSVWKFPIAGLQSGNVLSEIQNFISRLVLHDVSSYQKVDWLHIFEKIFLTLKMAVIGTFLGFLIALPLSFLSVAEFTNPFLAKIIRFILMSIRSVPALIWGLFLVAAVGLGPVAGIFSLTIYSVGYLGKMLYEGLEDLQNTSFKAVRQLGAKKIQAVIHTILPTSKPLLISTFIFMLEYNVRSASLLGIVGAGGIGQDLVYAIEWRDFTTVMSILIIMLAVVLLFDSLSHYARSKYKKLRTQ
jgi:phosphonate transport system permease protein